MSYQSTLSFLWGGLQPPPPQQTTASTSLYSGNQNTTIYPLSLIPSPTPQNLYHPPQLNNQFFLHSPQEGSLFDFLCSGLQKDNKIVRFIV